jgi:hypothetical protein
MDCKYDLCGPLAFTADGGVQGMVTVSSVYHLKLGAFVLISANNLSPVRLQIKKILSNTQLIVGVDGDINNRYDISAYTVALNGFLLQPEQGKVDVEDGQIHKFVFEHGPTNAFRNILVNRLGNAFDENNPIPMMIPNSINSPIQISDLTDLTTQLDEISDAVMYVGTAIAGASAASSVWRIKKIITTSTGLSVLYASGSSDFKSIWNDREELSYS